MEQIFIGLIMGEGCFSGDSHYPRLDIKLHARDLALLQTLAIRFDGLVYGPYFHGGRNYAILRFIGKRLSPIITLVAEQMPPCYKRLQFDQWREKWGI